VLGTLGGSPVVARMAALWTVMSRARLAASGLFRWKTRQWAVWSTSSFC